jgi:hypothetical protein
METIILVTIAFVAGWKLNELVMAASFKKILDDLKVTDQSLRDLAERNGIELPPENAAEATTKTEVEIKVEEVEGCLFAYDTRDLFLAQARDADTLLSRIIERFPAGTRITVSKEHGADIIEAAALRLKAQS